MLLNKQLDKIQCAPYFNMTRILTANVLDNNQTSQWLIKKNKPVKKICGCKCYFWEPFISTICLNFHEFKSEISQG